MGERTTRRTGVPWRSEAADSGLAVERAITYIAYGVAIVVLVVFPAAYFAAEHGPSACGMAFRVRDSHLA